jgi:hypothetical protein
MIALCLTVSGRFPTVSSEAPMGVFPRFRVSRPPLGAETQETGNAGPERRAAYALVATTFAAAVCVLRLPQHPVFAIPHTPVRRSTSITHPRTT